MKITKFAHCSLLVDTKNARVLFDPGKYSGKLESAKNLDAVIITHQHSDHLDLGLLSEVLKNNPKARVITHEGPAKLLERAGVEHQLVDEGDSAKVGDAVIEAFNAPHQPIYHDFNMVKNMGFMIDDFCFAGDSLHLPHDRVKVLALPVVAPWLKISEALDYALKIKPQICLPVHDGFLKSGGPFYAAPKQILSGSGIEFIEIENGASIEV